MKRIKKLFYAAGFYIISACAFADQCSAISTLSSASKWLGAILLPIAAFGFIMGSPQLAVSCIMVGLMTLLAPMMLKIISTSSMDNSLGNIDASECPPPPETHYWQSILGFLGSACYFVLPLIGSFIIMAIITGFISDSYNKAFMNQRDNLVKRTSGELLFYLNQLYRQLKEDKSGHREQTMELIYAIHENGVASIDNLESYVKSYRNIKANSFRSI